MQKETSERAAIIADDSSLIRDIVRSALGPPWRVFVAANGIEAVEFARTTRAQLILLDVRMPRLDGVDACSRIRAMPHCAHVPIVMLTAYDDELLRRRARRAGATTVFPKPFTTEQLRAGIAPLLALREDAAARANPSFEVPDKPPMPPAADPSRIDDQEALDVCRRVEAATVPRPYASFAEAMQALHDEAAR